MQAEPTAETARIPLRRRDGAIVAHAIVDAADYERLMQWTWRLSGRYAQRGEWRAGKSQKILMHRVLLGLEFGDPRQGDHENRVPLDCRRENLRIAPRGDKDNQQNQTPQVGRASQHRGVTWHKRDRKWQAGAMLNGKQRHLGYFVDEADAAAAASAFRAAHMPFSEDAARTRNK